MEGGDSKMDETTDSKVVETALTIRSVLPSASPMQAWKTPWFQDGGCQTDDQRETKTSDICMQDAQSSVHGKRDYSRGHWHLKRQQQHRQATLELLGLASRTPVCSLTNRNVYSNGVTISEPSSGSNGARSMNRALELQQRQDAEEIIALREENAVLRIVLAETMASEENDALRIALVEMRASVDSARHEERRLSAAFGEQAWALANETKHGNNDNNTAGGFVRDDKSAADSSSRASTAWADNSSSSSGGGSTDGSTDGSRTRTDGSPAPAPCARDLALPLLAAVAPAAAAAGPPGLSDLLERTRLSITGPVSVWLTGMQKNYPAACSEGLRKVLVLPWLLHKLFYLSTELIDERRQELENIHVLPGGATEGGAREDESAYRLHHLRSNYLTAFPLSCDSLRDAVDTVMIALAHSMIESDEWNPSATDPVALKSALCASGLERVVEEYLNIAVICCLQRPVVTFTDDLGKIERYNSEKHSAPIDGDVAGESCIVVFPAFIEAAGVSGRERVLGKRFVLNHHELGGAVAA